MVTLHKYKTRRCSEFPVWDEMEAWSKLSIHQFSTLRFRPRSSTLTSFHGQVAAVNQTYPTMVPKQADPPVYHHATKRISPSSAHQHLSTFLTKTQNTPHLHPDSLLSNAGIDFSATSGPRGGLAIHHLRRIEAGLHGENLAAETQEELDAQFGELPTGDDDVLDKLIEGQRKREKGRKRKREEIEEWAENSSQAGGAVEAPGREIESFAATPLHQSEWQEQEEYELAQRPIQGEIAEREPAQVVQQGGSPPEIVEHDADRHEIRNEESTLNKRERRERSKAEREARKASKKAKKQAGKLERIQKAREKG